MFEIDWGIVFGFVVIVFLQLYGICKMSARSNLHTALTALESAATSANAVIDQHLAGQVDMMGSGDVQATADRVYNVVASLQSALDKLKG